MLSKIKVNDWDDLKILFSKLNNFIFRGQSNIAWDLEPKIDRLIKNKRITFFKKSTLEYKMLSEFKKNAPLLMNKIPEEDDYFEWFSLMQHYGASTRLLDFTYSPFIATYFALEDLQTHMDLSVWAINRNILWKKICAYYDIGYPDHWFGNLNYKMNDIFNRDLLNSNFKRVNSVLFLEHKVNHERISLQQGLFLTTMDENQSFIDCLKRILKIENTEEIILSRDIPLEELKEKKILKFDIDGDLRKKIAKDLRIMNITTGSLFPGLAGFIKSLDFEIYNL